MTNEYGAVTGADVVVITSGMRRTPEMSRMDLLEKNVGIVNSIVEQIMKYALETIIVTVTNPLDVVSYFAWKTAKMPANRVVGMAGMLDASRFSCFLAQELGVSPSSIQALLL